MSAISSHNASNFTSIYYPKGYPTESPKDAEYVPHSEAREWLTWGDYIRTKKNDFWAQALESISDTPASTLEQIAGTRKKALSKFCDLLLQRVNACEFEYLNKKQLIRLLTNELQQIRDNDDYLRVADLRTIFEKISAFIKDVNEKIRKEQTRGSYSQMKPI